MKPILTALVVLVCIVTVPACGGKSGGPAGPTVTTPPPPTLSSLTINGPDSMLTRTDADYTVIAVLSDQQ